MTSVFFAVIALGLLVFAHELGHFLVAKLSGVGVLKFSLGFGKKIVGWKVGETEYMISAFPLGGYVKMIGGEGAEEEGELTPEEKKRSFMAQPLWKRMAIVFAGPMFNILLAIFLCFVIYVSGVPAPIARVADVAPGSAGQAAGFCAGDIIQKVDGSDIMLWEEVAKDVSDHPGKQLTFTVRRGPKEVLELKATPANEGGRGSLGLSGVVVMESLAVGSPADKAGMQPKDRVLAVDGKKMASWGEMADIIKTSPGKALRFTVRRDGKVFDTAITPRADTQGGQKVGRVGIVMGSETEDVSYGPVEALSLSVNRTVFFTSMTVTFISRLLHGKEDSSQLGGPIAIVQISGRQARQGFSDFVLFMALLSVNLGVMNLFPIPILDGGLLFFLAMEAVLGEPLSMRKREIAQQIGLFLLAALMVFVFYNDIMRLLGFSEMWK